MGKGEHPCRMNPFLAWLSLWEFLMIKLIGSM
jgi:hypothetical protein